MDEKGRVNAQAASQNLISFFVPEQHEQNTIEHVKRWGELKGFGDGHYEVTVSPEYSFFRCVAHIQALVEGQDTSGWGEPVPFEA